MTWQPFCEKKQKQKRKSTKQYLLTLIQNESNHKQLAGPDQDVEESFPFSSSSFQYSFIGEVDGCTHDEDKPGENQVCYCQPYGIKDISQQAQQQKY